MKTCRKCGVEKQLDSFNRDAKNKDGRNNWCKACVRDCYNARVVPNEVHGVARGQTWLYEGVTLTVLGVTPGPGGGYRVVYRHGKRNRTLSLSWLMARGQLIQTSEVSQ